ncbi:branched-chain amino acid ABC transporter permease [Basilea psittacipulmonis]|uniref:ABC transporter permease n=1 Tax=Basilea psittacipulmonis DSM 24701 TaxID=1072685 RepID=A0A077DIF9_9BURK|nr:branched-chain amino acid ABC transporter permease [Basilea psittacipulmonis]AIL32958.1 ABC transporter permease [Basilea psittacipulmonis DSM 24701]
MDWSIAKILLQDGLTTGVIYALMALALVLVFTVTRVVFIAQGEFLSFGALTFASMMQAQVPVIRYIPLFLGVILFLKGLPIYFKGKPLKLMLWPLLGNIVYPLCLIFCTPWILAMDPSIWIKALLTILIVVPMGPMIYRLVYEPVADQSLLTLLIVSIAVHFAFVGTGLIMFGPEGTLVSTPFFSGEVEVFGLTWTYQSLFVIGMTVLIILSLSLFFRKTLYGKALRATAVNRTGARLVGISTSMSGRLSFFLASLIGVISGIMLVSFVTIDYQTGFMIGLKGFVGAIIGGLASYVVAATSAILVGIVEAFSTFWASDYKEVIVFGVIIPVLLILSITNKKHSEDE